MMKKSAKILSVILSLAMGMSVLSLTACGSPEDPPAHTHTFASTWEKNDKQHWHPATCEHTSEKGSAANHNTTGANGSCSVCGFAPVPAEHVHTFEEAWEIDDEYHWHMASCEHYELIDGKAKHDTEGTNGACSVCGYAEHAHTFDMTVWKTSDIAHWHAATCEGAENAQHKYRFAADSDYHNYDETYKCTVCEYQHTHKVAEYKYVNAEGHWDAWDCVHQEDSLKNRPNFQVHDNEGANGACSCGWLPVVETATETNKHTHGFEWQWSAYYHWKKINCGLRKLGLKSCDKGYNADTPKNYDIGEHTFGENNVCTVCKFKKYSWGYGADCITCDDCGGCIKTLCEHENDDGHKKCGDARGADANRVTLEAEEGEVWAREDNATGSIADYSKGKRQCVHASYSNVGWTITVSKATKVTLRIHCGRTNETFEEQGAVWINGEKVTTKTPCAQPSGEDAKCNPAWLTFGCVELKEGENRIEIRQVGEDGFHLDKIELITDADVEIDYTPIDNTWLYSIGQYIAIPEAITPDATA